MRVAPVLHTRGPGTRNFHEVNANYRQANHRDRRAQRRLLPDGRLHLLGRDRDRPGLRRLPRLRAATSPSARCSPSSAIWRTSSIPSRTCRSSTTRTCPRRRRWTRSWTCSRKSRTSSTHRARPLAHIAGHVRFEQVRFGYGDGPEVIHGLDLDVPTGTTVALVGHTGAGKSTIAKLLARFYDPREGRITIDGTDISQVTQESLRSQLGIVPAGGLPLRGHAAREHRVRTARGAARGRDRRRAGRRRRRVRERARGRLRDAAR